MSNTERVRIAAVRSDTYHRNYDRMTTDHVEPCCLCGKGLTAKSLSEAWWIHLVDGGDSLAPVSEPDSDDPGELGWHPIGPDCARSIPLAYRQRIGHQ